MEAELVLAIHASVHHEAHLYGCLFTRIQGRRTDDCVRWSTPLDEFDDRILL